jgi:hypothetical protein
VKGFSGRFSPGETLFFLRLRSWDPARGVADWLREGVRCEFKRWNNFSLARWIVASAKIFRGAILLLVVGIVAAWGQNAKVASLSLGEPSEKARSAKAPVILVGFVGGFVRHENAVHSPVQLASRIRNGYPSGVHVEVFENRRREQAYQEIVKLLDADHDGNLSDEEKRGAQIIIYGMSWGGSETVALARELGDQKIPVLLTIQVDSVGKVGQNDALIPANVAEAANFYQTEGLLHGQTEIRAADGKSTRILGNFRFAYGDKKLKCENYPWYDRVFTKYHTEIECDPAVWKRVESLIRSKLPLAATPRTESGRASGSVRTE